MLQSGEVDVKERDFHGQVSMRNRAVDKGGLLTVTGSTNSVQTYKKGRTRERPKEEPHQSH